MLVSRSAVVVAVLLTTTMCHAWNGPGHQIIDLVAWGQLDDDDQERAVSLLRDHPRFEQHFLGRVPDNVWRASPAERDQWVFAFAGTWPDLVRSPSDAVTRDDVRRFGRGTWHYINLHVFLTPADRDALAGTLTNNRETEPPDDRDDPRMNVAQAIANAKRVLYDDEAPRGDRSVALCWLLHLVADAHQPCHSSALYSRQRFPRGDRGGNEIPVRGPGGDLHALWDQSLLPRANYNRVRTEAVEIASKNADDGAAAIESMEPKAWLIESFRLAKSTAYTPVILDAVAAAEGAPTLERIELPSDYFRAASEASRRRASQAGYRIAELIRGRLPESTSRGEPAFERREEPEPDSMPAVTPEPVAGQQHWLNTSSNARHNSSCRWFGKTKRGRYCEADEGKPCGECGG